MSLVGNFAIFATIATIVYIIFQVAYRLWFHPLAKFPGPIYTAISNWPEFYYDVYLPGKFVFVIEEMHKKYGRLKIHWCVRYA